MKKLKGYIYSREFLGERVPQSIQNLAIRDYCSKNSYQYFLSTTEYSMNNSCLMLEKTLHELKGINGVVAYSLFQLPYEDKNRKKIYNICLDKKKELHFVLENLLITKSSDIDEIENIWRIKKTLPSCFLGNKDGKE